MKLGELVAKTVFQDLILNLLVIFVAFFILLLLLVQMMEIETPKKQATAEETSLATDGKLAVVMRWPDNSNDDVDLYVKDPAGNISYFRRRDAGLMHLERDDVGAMSDTVITPSGPVKINKNEERTIIRGVHPGEYVVNVHMYHKRDAEETLVFIGLYRLRGADAEIIRQERVLRVQGDEQTAFRFTLKEDESVVNVNELPIRFIGQVPGSRPVWRNPW